MNKNTILLKYFVAKWKNQPGWISQFFCAEDFSNSCKAAPKLRQENCCEKICGFRKYPKFSQNFRNLAFHSSQIIISNILIHKCLIASPNICHMDLWDHSAPNCCAKSIFAINLRQKCAPNFVRVSVLLRRDVATGGVCNTPPTNTSGKNQVKSQKVKKKNQVNLRSTYTSKQ
jgi:hypothetical protein